MRRGIFFAFAIAVFMTFGATKAAELDSKAISIQLPKDIKWTATGSGSENVVLAGDPSKPGLYVVLTKWKAGNMSRPHSHPNDRYITVLSGTWWVGTGTTFDPAGTTPVPAGSFVTHFGKQIHYDGAKDQDVILQIVGIGPANSTSAAGSAERK